MVDRSVSVNLKADISDFNRKMLEAAAGAKALAGGLDTSTDRAANFTQSILAIGPALIPISAAAVPAIAGMANQLGVAAVAGGVAALAFHGLGTALDAVNKAQLEPTSANLQKMHESLAALGPAGADFVMFLQSARPELQHLQELARDGLFPGVEDGLKSLNGLLPDFESLISTVSRTLGDLASEAGKSLDSPEWHDFFTFLEQEARPTLLDMGHALGNFIEGLANLWMAFAPLSDNFSHSFLQLARDFNTWTEGLSKTQGFQDFVNYINSAGPKAWDTLGALANALLQIVEAAAPVGEATLPVIKALADALATIADSPVGPVLIGAAVGISAISRAIALYNVANGSAFGQLFSKGAIGGAAQAAKDLPAASRAFLDFGAALDKSGPKVAGFSSTSERLGASLAGTGKLALGAAGLGVVMSGLSDKVGLTNTVMGAMIGSTLPGFGTAIGAGIGAVIDLTHQTDGAAEAVKRFQEAFSGSHTLEDQASVIAAYRKEIEQLQTALGSSTGLASDVLKHSIDTLQAGLGPLVETYNANARAAQDAQFAAAGFGSSMDGVSQSTRDQTQAILDNIDQQNALKDALLGNTDKQVAYEQAIDAATAAADKNGTSVKNNSTEMDLNSAAGQNNQLALDRLAAAWNDLDPATQNAKGASERARAEFVKAAEQMGFTKQAAEELAEKYLHIPSKVSTDIVTKGQEDAAKAIKAVQDLLKHLDGSTATTYVNVVTKGGTTLTGGGNTAHVADGGYITGPGGPRDDAIPARLSNGEFVVNAAATARNLNLLHSINAQKFADGGTVGRGVGALPTSVSLASQTSPFDGLLAELRGLRADNEQLRQAVLESSIDGAALTLIDRGHMVNTFQGVVNDRTARVVSR